MMTLTRGAALLAVWAALCGADGLSTTEYSVTPTIESGALTGIQIVTKFRADDDGVTELRLPSLDRGHQGLHEALTDLTVTGAAEVTAPRPEIRIIASAPRSWITVRYRLEANLAPGEPQSATLAGLPALGSDSLYLVGRTVFSEVAGRSQAPVKFRWRGPRSWRFASDLEHLPPGAGWRDIAMSVIIAAPDLEMSTVRVRGTRVRVASLGAFDFDSEAFNTAASKIIATEQAFWQDGHKEFLVALAPLRDPSGQMVEGRNLDDAFTLLASPGIGMPQMAGLLAHEYFHSWNPLQLGGAEAGGAWFAEGFTDYYARKLALRAEVISLEEFVSSWNAALAEYGASPQRNVNNSVLSAERFNDPDLDALTYTRGSIFAAYAHARLVREETSLDVVMLALRDRARTDAGLAAINSRERLVLLAPSLRDDSYRFVRDGQTILLPPDTFGGCLTVQTAEVPVFDIGFDLNRTAANSWSITGVRPGSRAHQSGLRDGMQRIERLSGELNRSDVPISFRVRDGTAERTITYLPEGEERITRQQIVIQPGLDAAARTACARTASG